MPPEKFFSFTELFFYLAHILKKKGNLYPWKFILSVQATLLTV